MLLGEDPNIQMSDHIRFRNDGAVVEFRLQPGNLRLGVHVPGVSPTHSPAELQRLAWASLGQILHLWSEVARSRTG